MYHEMSPLQREYSCEATTSTSEPVPYSVGSQPTSMTSATVDVLPNSPCAVNDGSDLTVHVPVLADAEPTNNSKLLARTIRPAHRLRLSMTSSSDFGLDPPLANAAGQHSGGPPLSERNLPRASDFYHKGA